MRAPKVFRFTDLLSPDFYKRRPGRPRLPSWDDILPWSEILGPDDLAAAEAKAAMWRWRRRREGRPPNRERNQALLEGYRVAKSHGMTMRAFAKQWFRECYGCEATPDEVRTVERQIARLLKK